MGDCAGRHEKLSVSRMLTAKQLLLEHVSYKSVRAWLTKNTLFPLQNVNYRGLLQTVNIQALDNSYFSRSASSQTIIGSKRYTGTVTIATGASITVNSLDLDGLLNTWDMDQLHEEAWMDDAVDTVYGVKTFQQCISIEGAFIQYVQNLYC